MSSQSIPPGTEISDDVRKLLEPGFGEKFEDIVEAGVDKVDEGRRYIKQNPRKSSLFAASVITTWITVQFGIPFAINKYHETRAANDIEEAEQQLFDLASAQETALKNLDANRFIIKDVLEPGLDDRIGNAGVKSATFIDEIGSAKLLFEAGEFKEVRARLENDYDDAHIGLGLIALIEREIAPVIHVSTYSLALREKRDLTLENEDRLDSIMAFRDNGYTDAYLQNNLGERLRAKEPTLEFIFDIAYRDAVSSKANGIFVSARESYVSAAKFFDGDSFVHYNEELDGTMDMADYEGLIETQEVVFKRIQAGDSSLSELVSYKGKLTEQWFTIVTKKWEDYHMQDNWQWEDNPAYREWPEQECERVCTPKYCNERYCRQRANADGIIDEDCTTVTEQCGENCGNECEWVTKNNGEPERIKVNHPYRVDEYWVKTEKHTTSGISSSKKDVGNESTWRQSNNQVGYQVWKPFGDDQVYDGVGRIGPKREIPKIIRR